MKILYGVQGTGNGHISRARAMAPYLEAAGAEVDYLFSGRNQSEYFDMEVFGQWQCQAGLTFISSQGKTCPVATLLHNKLGQLLNDIKTLDLCEYDLVISDFEPITAWAARRQKVRCVSFGHQYAFNYPIPIEGGNWLSRNMMRWMAPAKLQLGLHWHHYDQPILPPIIDLTEQARPAIKDKILVYLGFESPDDVIPLLQRFPSKTFYYYGHFDKNEVRGNVQLRPLSRAGFKHDLADCEGVISNAGFELTSEALHLGKKVLVKPLTGQMEQLSNALAMRELALGDSMSHLDHRAIEAWLNSDHCPRCQYPDVAKSIVDYLLAGDFKEMELQALSDSLWAQTKTSNVITPHTSPKAA